MRTRSSQVFENNRRYIAGGVVSLNRLVSPEIAFSKAQGSKMWDVDGNEYIDYHGAFGPYILGHNDPDVNQAAIDAIQRGASLYGTGTNELEGRLAELICTAVPSVERVQITNTGSEATFHAIRLARAFTGRTDIIVMQGGYNGWHNDVACNVMNTLEELGERVSPGEYRVLPMSAGVPETAKRHIHVVNFNDLDSVEYVMKRYEIAAVILEPVLQNVGVIPPQPGYHQGLRELCDRYGAVLIFDEVKTGFRAALGGYQSISGVRPDLSVFGKALANGYPVGAVGGRREIMELFTPAAKPRQVLIAGTYNAHPVPTAAAIATIEKLSANGGAIYQELEAKTAALVDGLKDLYRAHGVQAQISRVGSAFCVYYMDHVPVDWHDVLVHHDFNFDLRLRQALIEEGIYHFPLATKQSSVSAAHTDEDIERTLKATDQVLARLSK